ncbi:hypothetical protein W59_06910 [Rhodococcus opacus RKJ300 = JCM 13270]|uniref:Uncharacterized protein n=1 Tax=Rhodococcus opacus RKJ300 = JCM 13270 TaxID=1165867 RepID=I0WW97_RHOOP|nr:hypothetical protein W59_06910 [Rhodococcus opacus RKJ300 = JCM 13270]
MSTAHVRALLDHVAAELPPESWPHWTEGWPHEIEAGLLDAAFSARATYGTPTTGVRAVVTRWRDHRAALSTTSRRSPRTPTNPKTSWPS